MGTRKEDVTDEISSENLQQKHDPDNVTNRSESEEKGGCASLSAKVVSDALQKRLSSDVLAKASQSDQDEGACPTTYQEVSHELQPRDSVDKGIDASQSNQEVNYLSKVPNKDSEDVHQKKGPDSKGGAPESKVKGSSASMSVEVVYHELNKRLSRAEVVYHELNKRLNGDACKASESIREEGAHPAGCQEVSGEAQPTESVDEGIDGSQSNQEDSSLSKVPEEESDNVHQKKDPKSEGGASESSQVPFLPKKEPYIKACRSDSPVKDKNITPVPGKTLESSQQIQSQKMEAVVRPDQEQVTYSIRPEKALNKLQPRRNPDMGVQALPSDLGINPFRAPEKPSEDGYNWRKYGQKLVRGNEFTRSYYRCTHPNCVAKKQVERSHDGHITDIHYIGKHEHPKPLNSPQTPPESVVPLKMRRQDMPMGAPWEAEGEKSIELGQTCQSIKPSESLLPQTILSDGGCAIDTVRKPHKSGDEADNGGPDSKRQKKEVPKNDDTPPIKYHSEPRNIVQTMSVVDIVNDGYRWRKYGQKMVKGNPNPRSYYRCSSAGCPAKKHVERASHDSKLVITAYEGQHVHDVPPSRTVMQNPAGADSNTTRISGEAISESGENKHVGVDRVLHIGAN